MTLNQIEKALEQIATNHKQINTYGSGDIWDIATSGDINYPLMWVSLEDSTIGNRTESLSFDIILMDIVKGGRVNEADALSDMLEVAKDVIAQLNNPSYQWSFANDSVTITNFTERFLDSVAGVTMKVKLDLPFSFDRCAMPYTQTTIPSSTNSAAGTIYVYLDGVLQDTITSTQLNSEIVNILWT